MKLGVFLTLLRNLTLEEALAYVSERGIHTVEIATGGFVGNHHLKPAELLENPSKLQEVKDLLGKYGMEISALSCHGNPLHPNEDIAEQHHQDFKTSILLAKELGVETVVNFSGCPGESDTSQRPVWITCPWPPDFSEIVEWQWKEKVIPYWQETGTFAEKHGIKIAVEPHPGFVVYNTETMLQLRQIAGGNIGVNFDPSHLFWQQMDPIDNIMKLGDIIYHFHAKDTVIHNQNTATNGVLDTKSYRDIPQRSWVFRTVGYGHGEDIWKAIISTLRTVGYTGAVSIEHEDGLMSVQEGFEKAVSFLENILITDSAGEMYWA